METFFTSLVASEKEEFMEALSWAARDTPNVLRQMKRLANVWAKHMGCFDANGMPDYNAALAKLKEEDDKR